MNNVLLQIKNRANLLNMVRLLVGITFIGEAVHSNEFLFGIIGLLLFAQIILNKKCHANGCEIDQ